MSNIALDATQLSVTAAHFSQLSTSSNIEFALTKRLSFIQIKCDKTRIKRKIATLPLKSWQLNTYSFKYDEHRQVMGKK